MYDPPRSAHSHVSAEENGPPRSAHSHGTAQENGNILVKLYLNEQDGRWVYVLLMLLRRKNGTTTTTIYQVKDKGGTT